jgi:hypothetical protein
MKRFAIVAVAVSLCLLGGLGPARANEAITEEMVAAGGGLQEYGETLAQIMATQVGTEVLGMPVTQTYYSKFPPTHTLTFTHDTVVFVKELIAQVQKEHKDKYKAADIVLGYILVFEREEYLGGYLGKRMAEQYAKREWERSLVEVGYRIKFSFYHKDPFSMEIIEDGETFTETMDQIGGRYLTKDTAEEIELGISSSEAYLDKAMAMMFEAIDSGEAKRRYEITDYSEDTLWKKRTLDLLKKVK